MTSLSEALEQAVNHIDEAAGLTVLESLAGTMEPVLALGVGYSIIGRILNKMDLTLGSYLPEDRRDGMAQLGLQIAAELGFCIVQEQGDTDGHTEG